MSDDAKERQVPAILIVIGIALYIVAAFAHAGPAGVVPTMVAVIVGGLIQTVLLIGAAFLVSSMLSVSFGDAKAAALKFAGAVLASAGLGAAIPLGGIVSLFVFLGLLMWLFELELTYAIALTVVYFVVSFVIGIALRSALT